MNLSEHCESAFQFVCRLKRIAKSEQAFKTTLSLATVRKDVDKLFREFDYRIIHDEEFEGDPEEMRVLLRVFVDVMIAQSGLKISDAWKAEHLSAPGKGIVDSEKVFFESLDKWLRETSLEANQRLGFFHTCLGLGFAQESARSQHNESVSRLDERMEARLHSKATTRFCPDAYDCTNEENYMERPLPRLFTYAATFVCLVGGIFYLVLTNYQNASSELIEAVDSVARGSN